MKKRLLAVFIALLILFSQITVFASDFEPSCTSTNPENKLTNELKNVINDTSNGEYIPIIVWLNDYGDEVVYSDLSNKYGIVLNQYNEDIYIESKITEKSNEYIENKSLENNLLDFENEQILLEEPISLTNKNYLNLDKNVRETEIKQFIEDSMTISEVIESTEKNQFLYDWRTSRKSINSSIISTFINKLNDTKTFNVKTNELVSFVSLDCEKSYIYELAKFYEVESIDYFNQNVEIINSNEQDTTNEIINEHHMLSQNYLEYDGTGIKVGVLEMKAGTNEVLLDANNVHLKNKFSNGKLNVNYNFCGVEEEDRTVSNHATLVTSILSGDEVGGYKGIAPNSTVYYAPFDSFPSSASDISEGGLFDALNWLISDCNVSIINMSCGIRYTDGQLIYYSFLDQYFDCLVSQYRITITKSSGNDVVRISSPGLAMNIITVGNLTKNTSSNGMYKINTSSSYGENNLSNKPDVVAFGTNVYMHGNTDTSFLFNSGTSFAAPQVAGTVALMMQANPNLIDKPDVIKSILISSAKSDIYPDTQHIQRIQNNGTVAICDTTNKAGGGLINIAESIKQAKRDDYQRVYFTNETSEFITNRYMFYAGETVEFTMVYEKGDHTVLTSPYAVDINVQILNSNNNVMFDSLHGAHSETCTSCPSGIDNVESFKVTLPETGPYTFKMYVLRENFTDNDESSAPIVHDSTHDGVYASLNVSCGCDDKNIQSAFTNNYLCEHTCSNCQTTFIENYSYDVETTEINYNETYCGMVKYSVKFRMNLATGVAIDNSYSLEFFKNEDFLYEVNIELYSSNIQYTPTGYKQTYVYLFIIYDSETEELKSLIYDTIHIVYDNRIEYGAYMIKG